VAIASLTQQYSFDVVDYAVFGLVAHVSFILLMMQWCSVFTSTVQRMLCLRHVGDATSQVLMMNCCLLFLPVW